MNKENIKNDPILYVVIKRNKTTKDNKDYNKERFDHLKNQPNDSINQNEAKDSQIWSIKELYGKKTLIELKKETSVKLLCIDQYTLQISEIDLAFGEFTVSYEGNWISFNYAIRGLLIINAYYREQINIEETESNHFDASIEIEKSLRKRRNAHHLSHNQKLWIFRQLRMKKQTENEIKEKYEISSSTIKRIIQSQKAEIIKYRTDTISTYLEWLSSSNVMEFIEAFIKRNKRAFTSFDLWRQVSEELSITIKPNVVNRVLKKWFALRYKKGSDRPTNLDVEKQKWLKALFWLHLVEFLTSFKLMINVDGWILTKSIKQSYSWLEKRKSWRIYNTKYKGSMSLLSAISSDGSSFTSANSSTVNSSVFLAYIKSLLEYYSKRVIRDNSEVLLIMDNCPYQTARSTREKLRKWRVNVLYLPPYWPELAPVELMFRSLKSKLKSFKEKESINYWSQDGIDLVVTTLKKIRPKEILNYWSQFYKEAKHCLHFIKDIC